MSSILTDRAAGRESLPARTSCPAEEALIEEARQRQRRRRRRRGMRFASLVLLAAALAVAAVLPGRDARTQASGKTPALPGAVAPMPPRIVVWTDNFRIEVRSAPTGRLVRTLATNVALYQNLPDLAVSRSGVVYFDTARDRREWILSVPLTGGPATTIAAGYSPAISPDGRMLAYLPWNARTCSQLPCTGTPAAIIVRDLPAGTQRAWAFTSMQHDITGLSWSPDSRFLAFAGLTHAPNGVAVRTVQLLDPRSGGTLDNALRIPLGQRVAWAGYLTPNTAAGVMLGPDGTIRSGRGLVELGVRTGRILRRLTSLPPNGLSTDNAIDGTENTITFDRSGRYLLIAAGNGHGGGEIFRWTFGMHRPVPVTSGALRAVWAG